MVWELGRPFYYRENIERRGGRGREGSEEAEENNLKGGWKGGREGPLKKWDNMGKR